MPPVDVTSLPVTIPAAAALLGAITLFLKFISNENDKVRKSHAEDNAANRLIFENHLSQSIKVQAKTTEAVGELVASIRTMHTENAASMQWARDAMQSLIREIGRSRPDDGPK